MIGDKQERYEKIKGTKCEACCDADWCWNALTSLRDLCLGPFKNSKDFKTKWDEFQKGEADPLDIERYDRRLKGERLIALTEDCWRKTDMAKKKREKDGKKDK